MLEHTKLECVSSSHTSRFNGGVPPHSQPPFLNAVRASTQKSTSRTLTGHGVKHVKFSTVKLLELVDPFVNRRFLCCAPNRL